MWIVSFCGSQVLIILFKLLVARPRPMIDHIFIAPYSFSFPSGHALASLTVYGMLAYFLIIGHGTWLFKTGIACTGTISILLISFSRLYLGVTFLSDVVCGLAGGLIWLSACISATELYRRSKVGDRRKVKRKSERKRVVVT
jgi:undecaprenyl-diphosphatase